ncbi:MAG: SusC/RagA family TonB-linked outer membrane protein, partial [Tannerella sp.]|nr:SusC/RagA family TonB-linked outer membrane protein [Tannerella sp.]
MEKKLKLTRTMKLTCMLLFLSVSFAFATGSYAQNTVISMNLSNKTVAEVLETIESETEFNFYYNSKLVDTNRLVSVHVKKQDVFAVLGQLFNEQGVYYKVVDKDIILTAGISERDGVTQNRVTVSGVVSDETGEPIIGANVVEKGTTNGIITDVNGAFSFSVSPGAILEVSYIGYKTKETPIDNKTTFSIVLTEDTKTLEEVVVVGYGTQRKRDVTGSVSSIDNEVITKQNAANPVMALRGQIAGLSIQQNNGRAGGEQTVILRGQSAIGKTVSPLVIIDGMPSGYGVLSDMDPEDIERVDVLKDASSTAIYGSRASGGVIIVTTKAGREQKNAVSYRGNAGVKKLSRNPEMMNTQEFYQFYQDGVAFRGEPQDNKVMADDMDYISRGIDTDWLGFILRDGFETTHNVSLNGGNKNETHYMSFGYAKEDGLQKSEGYERFSLNARVSGKVLDKLTAGASMYASYAVIDQGDQLMLNSSYRLRPWGNPYNDDGSYRFFPTQNESAFVNPIFDLQNTKWERKRLQARGMAYLEYKPIEGLTLKSSFMPQFNSNRTGNYKGEWTRQNVGKTGTSTADVTNNWGVGYVWENTANYTAKIANDHALNFTGLFSMDSGLSEEYKGLVQGLTYPNEYWYNLGASTSINSLTSSFSNTSLISYMGRMNYGFKEKYLLTVTGRWDGSSKLATGNQWGFFPSAALAWRAGEEE